MIQQGLNQLLTQTAYFMQPIGERKRDEKAFNKAQEEAEKRENQILEQLEGSQNIKTQLTDEQIEYAENLLVNRSKAKFERDPNAENLNQWTQAILGKDDMMEAIAEERMERSLYQKAKQEARYGELRKQLKREEKAPIPNPYETKGGKK